MSVIITLDDIKAYAEVDYIIHHMNERYIEKVPTKLLDFFANVKDPNYDVFVDPRVPLQNQGLKKYTLEILAILHVKYWCENEERKAELLARMQANQDKFEAQLREKFNVDKLFNDPSATVVNSLDDLEEKNDFSKPKKLTTYTVPAEENPIQEVEEVEETKEVVNNSLQKVEKKGFFAKLKSLFSRNK